MGLFKRISDIISANFNEMAERYEDPEKMLKQAIREMECSIRDATQETARAMATEKRLARELAHNQSESRQWQSRAEMAVEASDDDLARKALGRKQEHEKLAVAIDDQLRASGEASRTLRHLRLNSTGRKARAFWTGRGSASAASSTGTHRSSSVASRTRTSRSTARSTSTSAGSASCTS